MRKLFSLFLLLYSLSSDWAGGYQVIEDRATLPILNPNLAKREISKIRLKNGLEALIISDSEAIQSGALLSMRAGSFEDPEEFPGLAHFLEHMLFMGTEKYPQESEYQQFVSKNGGQTNAFTTDFSTCYLFTVQNAGFKEALDRFASFFKHPLFNSSGVERELNAIDQEFFKNAEDDMFRLLSVLKELANPNHPFHKFTTGNSRSLCKADRNILENWFRHHYSADLCRVLIYSPLSIEESAALTENEFGDLPVVEKEPPVAEGEIFSSRGESAYIYVQPAKKERSLNIFWQLDGKIARMKDTRPDKIAAHILGHEGKKSLLQQLKREKLAINIGASSIMKEGFGLLLLNIDLTEQGLRDVDQVIARVFQTISGFKESGLPRYIFDEIRKMEEIEYQYRSKEDPFIMLLKYGFLIQKENFATFPEQSYITDKYSGDDFLYLINSLTPQRARFMILTSDDIYKNAEEEKWMGIKYFLRPIPKDILNSWQNAVRDEAIDLPPPNEFIPSDLSIKNADGIEKKIIPIPQKIEESERALIYFAQDDRFRVPKISWIIQINVPDISAGNPLQLAMTDLFVKCFADDLSPDLYPALIGGLAYQITTIDNGIKIKIDGFNDKADKFLGAIMDRLKSYRPTTEVFEICKEELRRKYLSFTLTHPYKQAKEAFKSVLHKNFTTKQEKLNALRKINYEDFTGWITTLFAKVFIEATLYGNMDFEEAQKIANLLHDLSEKTYEKEERLKQQTIILPQDRGPLLVDIRTKAQGNAAFLAVENADFSFVKRAAQQILMQAIQTPFFAALRTRQQTGYLAFSCPEEEQKTLFNIFALQSVTHDPRDLLARFEEFIESFLRELKREVPKESFLSIQEALIRKYQEPAENIREMGELLFLLASKYEGDFSWIAKRLEGIKQITYPEFISLAHDMLGRGNKRRLAILLRGAIPEEKRFSYTKLLNLNAVKRESTYR